MASPEPVAFPTTSMGSPELRAAPPASKRWIISSIHFFFSEP